MFDLIIVGGGPASQAAAIYALGKQLNCLMIAERLGGRASEPFSDESDDLKDDVLGHYEFPDERVEEATLIGSSAVHLFERLIKGNSESLLQDRVTRISHDGAAFQVETAQHGVMEGRAVIFATGAAPRRPKGLVADDSLIADLGYTVTSHASSAAGKRIAVIGSTEQVLYGAADMARTAAQVYVVVPGIHLPDSAIVGSLRQRPNVTIIEGCQATTATGAPGAMRLFVGDGGETRELEVEASYADFGMAPGSALVRDLAETDAEGFVRIDDGYATSLPGLFAAGDVARPYGDQVLIAIGEGARAALSAHHYLLEQGLTGQVGA